MRCIPMHCQHRTLRDGTNLPTSTNHASRLVRSPASAYRRTSPKSYTRSVSKKRYVISACTAATAHKARSSSPFNVVALGNVCLDVVHPVPFIPVLDDRGEKLQLLEDLSSQDHPISNWEVGGNCNFAIAAARLGLQVDVVGHWGSEKFGDFVQQVLLDEDVNSLHHVTPERPSADVHRTLVCFVLVDPQSKHAFCSDYDLGPAPLFSNMTELPPTAVQVMLHSKAIFTNAFIFDEVPFHVVKDTVQQATQNGSSFFFDPGPRCFSMVADHRRPMLEAIIDMADVVLMTEDEAAAVTGLHDPKDMCRWVLERPNSRVQWVVVKLGPHGAMLATRDDPLNPYVGPPLRVQVQDTVGCGDSFASGVVLGYLTKSDLACTLMLANAVGAATATGRGAGRNVADAETVTKLLREAAASQDVQVQGAAERALLVLDQLIKKPVAI